jgi:ATP-dependent RNA helicase DHX8/PRP22
LLLRRTRARRRRRGATDDDPPSLLSATIRPRRSVTNHSAPAQAAKYSHTFASPPPSPQKPHKRNPPKPQKTKELERLVGVGDRTLAEFIIDLAQGSRTVDDFKASLRDFDATMADSVVERLWGIIQHIGGGPGGGGASTLAAAGGAGAGGAGPSTSAAAAAAGAATTANVKPHPAPRAGAAIPGLALENTRGYARRLDEELIEEGKRRPAATTTTTRARSRSRSPPGGDNRGAKRPARSRSRSRSPARDPAPRMGGVYRGRVTGVMDFGCFIELDGSQFSASLGGGGAGGRGGGGANGSGGNSRPQRYEGMCHVSNISSARLASARGAVERDQPVWVKVVSVAGAAGGAGGAGGGGGGARGGGGGGGSSGARLGLSMRDVDQKTGRDLLAAAAGAGAPEVGEFAPGQSQRSTLAGLSGVRLNPADGGGGGGAGPSSGRGGAFLPPGLAAASGAGPSSSAATTQQPKRAAPMSEVERWEAKQLAASGVLDASELPEYDDPALGGSGVLPSARALQPEEEFEVDLNDAEPEFLRGFSSRSGAGGMSPVRVVKNPEGSLQRAAMTASALAKERRELQVEQQRTLEAAVPRDLSRPWEDPMPEEGERHLAMELRGLNMVAGHQVPEWKEKALGEFLLLFCFRAEGRRFFFRGAFPLAAAPFFPRFFRRSA